MLFIILFSFIKILLAVVLIIYIINIVHTIIIVCICIYRPCSLISQQLYLYDEEIRST